MGRGRMCGVGRDGVCGGGQSLCVRVESSVCVGAHM